MSKTAPRFLKDLLVPNPELRLREQWHEVMRFKHYAVRTEETYWGDSVIYFVSRQEASTGNGPGGSPRVSGAFGHAEPRVERPGPMNKIVHYIGLDVHQETIAVAIAPENTR